MDGDNEKKPNKRRIRPATETIRQQTDRIKLEQDTPKKKKIRPFYFLWTKVRIILRPFFRPVRWAYRHFVPRYFRDSFSELAKVTWPNRKQSRQLTFAVIVFACIFAALVSAVDSGFDRVFKKVFLKE